MLIMLRTRYGLKYMVQGIVWLFVALYNGVVSLVEKIINDNREDPIE